jgi:hypothetical protein
MEDKFIEQQELQSIKFLKQKLLNAELQKQSSELELKNLVLQLYLKYKLDETDQIEEQTGKILKTPVSE